MRGSTWIWIIIALIIILGGGYYLFVMQPATATPNGQTVSLNNQGGQDYSPSGTSPEGTNVNDTPGTNLNVGADASVSTTPMTATVTYNGTSFSPASVTIAKGGKVTFVNNSGKQMWVASDEHPSHTEYDGTSRAQHCPNSGTAFDECAGQTGNYSFTFNKTGSFDFHDHLNASAHGTVVVK